MGKKFGEKVNLVEGVSHSLPFEEEEFDMVIAGFCLYMVGPNTIIATLSEMNRVLKQEGILVISDFDTPYPYIRHNKHNAEIFTYKRDYLEMLRPFGYTLIEKRMHSYFTNCFVKNVQERSSTLFFYKEHKQYLDG